MSMIVLPYIGARAASRELAGLRLAPPRAGRPPARSGSRDPLEGLEMRLTYRTVRVLVVIAGRPGASNREIAEGSGIADQGQISKLLTRLRRLELVQNRARVRRREPPNAWHLTERGDRGRAGRPSALTTLVASSSLRRRARAIDGFECVRAHDRTAGDLDTKTAARLANHAPGQVAEVNVCLAGAVQRPRRTPAEPNQIGREP